MEYGKNLLEEQLVDFNKRLLKLEELFKDKIQYDYQKEELFDKLYQDLENKQLLLKEEYLKSFYLDLLMLYDNIVHKLEELKKDNREQAAIKTVSFFLDELLEVLARREIELILRSDYPEDLLQQKIVSTHISKNPADDNKIIKVVQDGFTFKGKVLRQQSVEIAKYQPKEEVK